MHRTVLHHYVAVCNADHVLSCATTGRLMCFFDLFNDIISSVIFFSSSVFWHEKHKLMTSNVIYENRVFNSDKVLCLIAVWSFV